jgi:hypothetical protein
MDFQRAAEKSLPAIASCAASTATNVTAKEPTMHPRYQLFRVHETHYEIMLEDKTDFSGTPEQCCRNLTANLNIQNEAIHHVKRRNKTLWRVAIVQATALALYAVSDLLGLV